MVTDIVELNFSEQLEVSSAFTNVDVVNRLAVMYSVNSTRRLTLPFLLAGLQNPAFSASL
jgi:hypothetical protein